MIKQVNNLWNLYRPNQDVFNRFFCKNYMKRSICTMHYALQWLHICTLDLIMLSRGTTGRWSRYMLIHSKPFWLWLRRRWWGWRWLSKDSSYMEEREHMMMLLMPLTMLTMLMMLLKESIIERAISIPTDRQGRGRPTQPEPHGTFPRESCSSWI